MILRRLPACRWVGVTGPLITVFIVLAVGMTVSNAAEPPTAKSAVRGPQWLRQGEPQAHGLTAADLNALRAILRTATDDRTVPGVSLLLAHKATALLGCTERSQEHRSHRASIRRNIRLRSVDVHTPTDS